MKRLMVLFAVWLLNKNKDALSIREEKDLFNSLAAHAKKRELSQKMKMKGRRTA